MLNLYMWGWPSFLGGADTKFAHLIDLLYQDYNITIISNNSDQLNEQIWTNYMDKYKVNYCSQDNLPSNLDGISLALCNMDFFKNEIYKIAKNKGTKVIWSSEMMWHHGGELEAIKNGYIDKILYVSDIQKSRLNYSANTPWSMTGNYINPDYFPFKERDNIQFTIGRLSRHDPDKYPEDFPIFYELLDIPNVKFRVMGWDDKLKEKYKWHNFDDRWELLWPNQEDQVNFLHSLDLFVYPLGHKFTESWGRSTVEAMLTGAIPFVQTGHNLENLIENGKSGYVLDDFQDIKFHVNYLYRNEDYRKNMARQCSEHARNELCNREKHLNIWKEALDV
jgi:glycosyltransferase involved in cell wall biosynthesis